MTPSSPLLQGFAVTLASASLVQLTAAPVDLSKIPPAASGTVDFDRDIRPIFDQSCLRCHGPEKPKSGFRLDDREAAMKGGKNGVAIIPGKGEASPLIHYVSRLVEDMEMPPQGKGDPLTPQQIGLLRAWIDQGATWGTSTNSADRYQVTVSPVAGFVTVKGNEAKFREHQWQPEGANGGIQDLEVHDRLGKDTQLTLKARALRDEYSVRLTLEKPQVGSIRVGWEQFRKYSSDVGGYHPSLTPSSFALNRDLGLDNGRAWVDFTLNLPDWPVMTVGYEYQYRDGDKAMLNWGPVTSGGVTKNVYPAYKSLRESVHVLKFDLDHDLSGYHIQDQFRGEFYDLKSFSQRVTGYDAGGAGITDQQALQENARHFQGANTLRVERQFKDWLFGSGGYLYSQLQGDAAIGLVGTYYSFPGTTPLNGQLASQDIVLRRESHVANLNALWGPWQGFTLTTAAQAEWTGQSGIGKATLVRQNPLPDESEAMSSNSDRSVVEESVALRYVQIPRTVLFAEARLKQESTELYQDQSGGIGGGFSFIRQSDISAQSKDWRVGFSSSPESRWTFGGHFRQKDYSDHFNRTRDEAFGFLNPGYPSFIRQRETATDEVEARCAVRVTDWLKTTLTYKWTDVDYWSFTDASFTTPGGGLYSGKQDAHTYSFNATLTPWRRLYLGNTLTYRHSRTTTENNGVPYVVPYKGDLYSLVSSASYVLSETTDWTTSYTYSRSDYGQNNVVAGLPVGLDFELHGVQTGVTWRFRKTFTTRLQYGFYNYDEKNTGGYNNYTAHAVFAMLSVKLP